MEKVYKNLTYSLTQAIQDAEKKKLEEVEASVKVPSAVVKAAPKSNLLNIPETINIQELRKNLKMSQTEFCARFGININTLRNWEQGRRLPDEATRAYLYAISRNAALVEQALHS